MENNIHEDTHAFLNACALDKYTEVFIETRDAVSRIIIFMKSDENEIDIATLPLLDDDQIKVLIPTIGPQARFKKTLTDWKASLKLNSQEQNCQELEDLAQYVCGDSDDVVGLAPCFSSPTISVVSSPTTSTVSAQSYKSLTSRASNSQCHEELTILLGKTPDGQLLLKENQQPLGEQYHKILVREMAANIVKINPKAPVTADTFLYWLEEINKVFPKENCNVYYTKSAGASQRAHGRLFDAVTNLKAKYRRNKVFEPRARRSLEKTFTPKPFSSNYLVCAEKWDKTNKERLKRILSKENPSYLQEFPCIQRSWGYTLLIADFNKWYPGNENSFDSKTVNFLCLKPN